MSTPDYRLYVVFYAGTQAALDARMAKVWAICRERKLYIVDRNGGNGHWTITLSPSPKPHVCSGTRGRGRKQARARRRNTARLLASGEVFIREGGVPDDAKMQHRRWRRRRGPKGHRVLVP